MTLEEEIKKIFDNLYIWDNSPEGAVKIEKSLKDAQKQLLNLFKQYVEEIIKKPSLLPKNSSNLESVKQGINFYNKKLRQRLDNIIKGDK